MGDVESLVTPRVGNTGWRKHLAHGARPHLGEESELGPGLRLEAASKDKQPLGRKVSKCRDADALPPR